MTMLRFALLLFLTLLAAPLAAAESSIVAIVNDEVITSTDRDNRINLVFLSSGMQQDPETLARVKERIMRNLIDEQLQLQEAKRYDISVEQAELDKAFESVARQNGMTAGEMEAYMQTRGVPKDTLLSQIRASLSWAKVVQRVLRAQVEVGEDEVNAMLERIKANEGKPEYLMSEIFLAVENPSDEEKVRDLAGNLLERMKQGTGFAALAQQFSQGTGAISGGDLGWVQPGQLAGELDRAVRSLAVGQTSLPIRTPDGFYIMAKRDERVITAVDPKAIEVKLKQATMALQGRTLESVKETISKFRETVPNCGTLETRISQFPEWQTQDLGTKKIGDLPGWLAHMAQTQMTDAPSKPMEKGGYAFLLYVCERNDKGADKTSLTNMLGNEKLELQARRLLRDLRRAASIENRG